MAPAVIRVLLILSILSTSAEIVVAQSQERSYSTFIISFSKGIVWPKSSVSDRFVIGVLEYDPLFTELNNIGSNIKVENRKLEIKKLSSMDEIAECNILFIPAYKTRSFQNVLHRRGNTSTLLITNKTDMVKKGSDVNFVLINGRLQYEINCKAIERRGMKISANIKGMGILVEN